MTNDEIAALPCCDGDEQGHNTDCEWQRAEELDALVGQLVYVENRLFSSLGDPQTCWNITGKLEKESDGNVDEGIMPQYAVLHRTRRTGYRPYSAVVTFTPDKVQEISPARAEGWPVYIEVLTP